MSGADLGYILLKNPSHLHTFELPFGKAHVFYPELMPDRAQAALLIDVDLVGLVRGRSRGTGEGSLDQYVNDRPYAASSLLSVAIARVFGTAMSGRSKERQELAEQALDLEATIAAVPCRGGESFLRKLFEPLGYTVHAEHHPLDERFPEWGEGPYYTVRVRARKRLQELLTHIYVLVPVLDAGKHYWVGEDEVDKLLRKGDGWLAAHPERENITSRYLRGDRKLTREALARLTDDDAPDPEAVAATSQDENGCDNAHVMDIRQVAKRAGVSTATVSRTINNHQQVRPGTARRVWRAIEELKYFPNTQARSLVSGRSRMVGLIVSDITNPFFPELVKGFEDAASRHGYEVLLSNTEYDSTRMATGVRRMLERKVDAVAIMTSEMDGSLTQQLAHRDIPMVFLDVGKVDKHVSNIRIDYALGISQAVGHLLELGHRRIAFISGPGDLKSARIRRLAFLKAMKERGVSGDESSVETGNHRIDGGFNAMNRILDGGWRPTAVLCSNDLTAIGGLRAIRRHGLRVPDDISVVGFDDIALAEFTEPPLTTVRLPRRELAGKAFEALLASLGDTSRMGVEYSIAPELVVRESTAKASD